MLRMKAFVFCAGVIIFLASVAAAGVSTAVDKKKGRAAAQVERGRAVYATSCGRCHGADGQGHTRMAETVEPPDLSDAAWQRQRSNARMIASVTNGRGQMPAFSKRLLKQDIAAAVAYVRTLRR
ncbi:MAG: cytochrome c6 [Acidobacteriota bacterium]|jgi:cytochrome c oxidase cbb3-type subunit 3|nr:cytochrome c6 [Acidobacteriota bacterium]MDT7808901.1 cytochrome c6 [Acidobacteriota bacterium]